MKYILSHIVPIRFTSDYRSAAVSNVEIPRIQTWWQWRNRIFRQRVQ